MQFAVFDLETRIDKSLLNRVYFAGEGISDDEAYQRHRDDLRRRRNSDFLPLSFHLPISIAVGLVGEDYLMRSVESLASGAYSEEELVRQFWSRTEHFDGCLVSFNGRRFDLPVLELAALRYGISAPGHFADDSPGRARYLTSRHLDLLELLSNHGAAPIAGGLDCLLKMIGMPGKTQISGADVQAYYEAGRMEEIHRYCRSDVIQTYFLFLRVELMRGRIARDQYQAVLEQSSPFIREVTPQAGTE